MLVAANNAPTNGDRRNIFFNFRFLIITNSPQKFTAIKINYLTAHCH
jgi:hypothetical protein